jgi:hypothetical protein
MTPTISVLLPAMHGYNTVLAALDAWDAQSCRDQIELLVLCPSRPDHDIPDNHVIVEIGSLLLHEARAVGVRRASADHVMFAEDHCLPDPDCVASLLSRIDGKSDAIGPALRSGNPQWAVTQASFLISYSQWMLPAPGAVRYLPGHNVVLRKTRLLEMGTELEHELLFAAFLMQRLKASGCSFVVDDKARMRHYDPADWRRAFRIFYTIGSCCGALRLERRAMLSRALYSLLAPAIFARHFGRGLLGFLRVGRASGLGLESVLAAVPLACAWTIGEVLGAWRTIESIAPSLWISEVKPVQRHQVV